MQVDIEEFKKINMRVGEVVDVEEGEADKLLIIVDAGKIKKIASSIKGYRKENLLGKKVIILDEGGKQASILIVRDRDKHSVLTVDKDVGKGAKVR
ncbi:MAG: hypothetical protein ACE5NL_00845 [Candidatus Hydrothermarchaeaceae archaeon]